VSFLSLPKAMDLLGWVHLPIMKSPFATLGSLLASLLVVSCSQGPTYPEPKPTPGVTATIHESSRGGGFMTISTFGISTVDGLPLRLKTRLSRGGLSHTLPAGKHELTLGMTHSSPEYKDGLLHAKAKTSVTLKPDTHYEASGELLQGRRMNLWLQERESKKKVSPVVQATASREVQPVPIIMPVPAG
jgi:hypothetical protein